jgi:hypothetical protein
MINMTTVNDLMLKVKNELKLKGFDVHHDFSHTGDATKDGKSEWKPVEGWNFKHLFGYTIKFEVVHRHNATAENQSVDIMVYRWDDSSGKRIAQERINTKMGERAIMNRINKIVDMYETL